jgi:hypothetical protein
LVKIPVLARYVACFLVLLAAAGCVATRMKDVWQAPSFERKQFDKVLVVAFTANKTNRILFEQGFVRHLREAGLEASSSYDVVSKEFPNRESIAAYVKAHGLRYVVVSRFHNYKEDKEYVPAQIRVNYSGPYYHPYYRGYWDSYGSVSVRETGAFVDKTTEIMLATSIYDVSTEELVWIGHSKTFEVGAVSFSADELAGEVISHIGR